MLISSLKQYAHTIRQLSKAGQFEKKLPILEENKPVCYNLNVLSKYKFIIFKTVLYYTNQTLYRDNIMYTQI